MIHAASSPSGRNPCLLVAVLSMMLTDPNAVSSMLVKCPSCVAAVSCLVAANVMTLDLVLGNAVSHVLHDRFRLSEHSFVPTVRLLGVV